MIPFRKSLAFRILSSFIILLCFPLLVDAFIAVNQSYIEGEASANKSLKKISTERVWSLTELLLGENPTLTLLENDLQLRDNFPKEPSRELDQKLASLARAGNLSEIVLLKYASPHTFTIVASSLNKDIGKEATSYIQSIDQDRRTFSLIFVAGNRQYEFMNAKYIYSQNHELLGAILVYRDISQKLNELLQPDVTKNPIFFSLVLENSLIFASSDPDFNLNYFIPLSAEDKQQVDERREQIKSQGIEINDIAQVPLSLEKGENYPLFTFLWKSQKWLAYLTPIGNSHYYFLSYVSRKQIYADILANFIGLYGIYLVILFIGSLLAFAITKRFSRPLSGLTETMHQIRQGNYEIQGDNDKWGFEINTLITTFNDVINTLVRNKKEIEEIALKAELYKKELALGEEVQRRLYDIPKPIPVNTEIATRYIPAKEVGGDFCDHFMQDDHLVLMIADAAGKGVEACFYSLIVRGLIRTLSQEIDDVTHVIKKANQLFLRDVEENGVFVTATVAFFDPHAKKMTYFCSGHNPPIVRRSNGSVEILRKQGAALGIEQSFHTPGEVIYFEAGDSLIFYTDGVTEAHDSRNNLFSEERLIKIIIEEGGQGATHLCQKIVEEVRKFEQGTMQHDDITLMILGIKDV